MKTLENIFWRVAVPGLCVLLLPIRSCFVANASTLLRRDTSFKRHQQDVETFEINLDLPPQDRWNTVIAKYKKPLQEIRNWIVETQIHPKKAVGEIITAANLVEEFFPRNLQIRQEMEGVAHALEDNTPVGLILLMNLFYDIRDDCTSVVAHNNNTGVMWHGRNLDYFIPNLQAIMINVNFTKGGKLLYMGTTFAGYVGVPTGMKPGAFTISQNERKAGGTIWDNLAEWILKGGRAYSFLFRDILENAIDYDDALDLFQRTPLIAPSYFIIAGSRPGQGAVVSRARDTTVDTWTIDDSENRWFLVQTNDDHWLPPEDDRRDATNQHVQTYCTSNVSATTMTAILNMKPTLNKLTTYTTVMSAGDNYFHAKRQNVVDKEALVVPTAATERA